MLHPSTSKAESKLEKTKQEIQYPDATVRNTGFLQHSCSQKRNSFPDDISDTHSDERTNDDSANGFQPSSTFLSSHL